MVDETTGGKPLLCQGRKLTAATVLLELCKPENVSRIAQNVARRMADADHVAIPTAALTELLAAAEECAGDLEAEAAAKFPNRDVHVAELFRYERDMAPVRRLRAAVARVRGE